MTDIYHDFPIRASQSRVYETISSSRGLDSWWTKRSSGQPTEGAEYELWFGPEYDWRARVTRSVPPSEFELQMTKADSDWIGTRVGFRLEGRADTTQVHFYHTGWPAPSEHWRVSCYCWAMYLRILRRHLEHSEDVPYEMRLDA